MKKILLISLFALLLTACGADYSYSIPEDASTESREEFHLEEASFLSPYYLSLGEAGLQRLSEGGQIRCLLGRHGNLLCANTPTRMIFCYETEKYVQQLMEYNKLTGEFAPACHDVMCSHEDCLFSVDYKVFGGALHLYFLPHTGDGGYYMSELDGTESKLLPLPADAFLHAETEEGLYWEKTELIEERAYYSLWLYSFSNGESRQIAQPAENVSYYVTKDGVYLHDLITLTLYRIDPSAEEKTKVADGVISLASFGGWLYDYDHTAGAFKKLSEDGFETVATIQGVSDYWVSEGYIYFFREDRAFMESVREDRELYQYLSEDNPTCGGLYRIKEGDGEPQLLCRLSHDGKPALIEHLFADGEVIYVQYRDYESFFNRYNEKRGEPSLAIIDATTGSLLEIPG